MLEAGFAALSFSETSFMTLRMLGGFVLPAGHLIIDVSETAGFPPPPGGDGLRQASPKRKRGRYGLLRRWKNRHFGLHHRHQGRGRTYPTPPRWSLKTPTALFSAGSASSGDGGRGEWQSYCVLVPNSKNPDARVRFKALCATTDGLQIAQADLARHGPGDFFGTCQHSLLQFHMADQGWTSGCWSRPKTPLETPA